MAATPRRAASLLALCLIAFSVPAFAMSCLIFPLSCLKSKKKYGDEMETTILDIRKRRTDAYDVNIYTGAVTADPLQNTRTWYIWFKVGETLYQGERDETILQMGYTPKREDWVGKKTTLRFRDKKWLGMKGAEVVFKKENGKEWSFGILSIVGPDGIDECKGHIFCPQQAEVDRPAREQEQLAKLGKAGAKSATEVEPAPIEEPQEDAAVAAASAAGSVAPAPELGGQAGQTIPADQAEQPAQSVPVTEAAPAMEAAPATEPAPAPAVVAAPATDMATEPPPGS